MDVKSANTLMCVGSRSENRYMYHKKGLLKGNRKHLYKTGFKERIIVKILSRKEAI